MPLPQAELGDAENILVKAEGNALRFSIQWNLINESTSVVTSNVGGDPTGAGPAIDSSKYASGTINKADEMAQFLVDEFQCKGVEYKFQIIIPAEPGVTNAMARFGTIEKLSLTKAGRSPVTWRANMSFVDGDLVTVGT